MFGSLQQSLKASFADRFIESDAALYFRPLGSRRAYRLSPEESAAGIDDFAAVIERADRIRGRTMKAIIPAVILWAFICLFLRRDISREAFGDTFYVAIAMALMIGLPAFAYGQFWLSAFRNLRNLGKLMQGRPSIHAPIIETYRTRNPFQLALRWTALLALGAFILIGGILPETHPQLAGELKPWIRFDMEMLLAALGLLYGLSMLWDWLAAPKAAN